MAVKIGTDVYYNPSESSERSELFYELYNWAVAELKGLENLAQNLLKSFHDSPREGPLVVDESVLTYLADTYAQQGLLLPYLIVLGIACGFERSPSPDVPHNLGSVYTQNEFVDGAYIRLCNKVWRDGGGKGVVFLPGSRLDIIRSSNRISITMNEGPLYGEKPVPGFVAYNCICAIKNVVSYVPEAYEGAADMEGKRMKEELERTKGEVVGMFISFITDKNFPDVLRSFQR